MTREEAAELLDLIVSEAPRLRAAGVLTVSLGGAGFTLAVADAQATVAPVDDDGKGKDPEDVLHDVWTHGRPTADAPRSLTVKRSKV